MNAEVLKPAISGPVTEFTRAEIVWKPWLRPMAVDELTDAHVAAFKSPVHAKSEYFRLLAKDVPILKARSKTDADIFYSVKTGLPRAERELAAVAVSRFNGCIYCASVHARFSSTYSKRGEDLDRLLAKGVREDLGERWNAIVAASTALSATPPVFGERHVTDLREAGLTDLEIVDVINCAAFFNWANRLMLSLGEPGESDQPGI